MAANNSVEKIIAQTFIDIANGLETVSFGSLPKMAVTALGSEHGEENILNAAVMAANSGIDVTLIGAAEHESITTAKVTSEDEAHKKMEELLTNGDIDGVVTMHYPFPIGVSTVGRVVTPAFGKEMFIATTTGTSSADRVEGMIKNAIYGIITAKACGIKNPTVGILNIDGARQTETALKKLKDNGYDITFATSARADGGCIMRGNDLLTGSCDVMVTDSLTGNILIKTMSAFTSGGSYESVGYGYGPGIGEGYDKLVLIVSRASGSPVIANALKFGAQLVKNNYKKIAESEFEAANKAGLKKILENRKESVNKASVQKNNVIAPAKEIVTYSFAGIEIMDLEDAVQKLWSVGIYAESGMGCTGPIVLVSEANKSKAEVILKEGGWIS